jgi:hypothetical protein
MATKKTVPVSKIAKSPTTAIVAWEQEMAGAAVAHAAGEKAWGSYKSVSTQGGVMKIDDEAVDGNELRVIVIASIHENQYYDSVFNPGVMTVPKCYAYNDPNAADLSASVEEMTPHPNAEEPQGAGPDDAQGQPGGNCNDCWANVMGTADVGRGKACKNIRRLALVTEDALASPEAMADAEVRFLKVPVMSTKLWGSYTRKLAEDVKRPSYGVVTTVKIVPDAKAQFLITFAFEELISFDNEMYAAMKKKVADVLPALTAPYPSQADLEASAPAPKTPQRPGGRTGNPGKPGVKKPASKKF